MLKSFEFTLPSQVAIVAADEAGNEKYRLYNLSEEEMTEVGGDEAKIKEYAEAKAALMAVEIAEEVTAGTFVPLEVPAPVAPEEPAPAAE